MGYGKLDIHVIKIDVLLFQWIHKQYKKHSTYHSYFEGSIFEYQCSDLCPSFLTDSENISNNMVIGNTQKPAARIIQWCTGKEK